MLGLSWSTFRERWQLFIGAILTVAVGVALVQSSLLILISAATAEVPAGLPPIDRARLAEGYESALALLGVTLGFSAFLAVFIVSSTFAFTVAQRRRDLALLRLVGGAPAQVRRLLLSEALLLGLIGTTAGVPLGLLVMRLQTALLTTLGFLPTGFTADWRGWILGVSIGAGIGVALAGVYVAARRAARVRPLEALRDSGSALRVMSFSRWFFGLLFLAGGIAMVIIAPFAGPVGAQPLAINAALAASVGLAALSPLVVPLVGRLFGLVLRGGPAAHLARANVRDNVRRGAATAAPLLVLVALLVGQSSVLTSIGAASLEERRRTLAGDLVVESTGGDAERIADTPGVAVAATETAVPVSVTRVEYSGKDDEDTETTTTELVATAVDPGAYTATHPMPMTAGSLTGLTGRTVALGADSASDHELELGGTLTVAVPGTGDVSLRVVAILPETMTGGEEILLPADLLPAAAPASDGSRTIVRLEPGAEVTGVADGLRAAGVGEVSGLGEWIERSAAREQDAGVGITGVVMGLGGLYALMAVINAVVIAAAERRPEFAAARVTGFTRWQVVRMALLESWVVTTVGIVLGGLAATLSLVGIVSTIGEVTGTAVVSVPWALVGAVVAGAFVVVGATSVCTSWSATRPSPVSLVTARE
ncbi:ABC transporter permease [Amycolatopsis antarctica]|uniref:ABC transporter permease n=1 Tax=Amycolatopsis antarctica TaxID=1854586 RepID=A0A263DA80_9PSEU|nr:ABC transporter permease [Amycolatopsis antarctica]OZM74285.1 ABC transporter permease [Amycolatopsis antarctica]